MSDTPKENQTPTTPTPNQSRPLNTSEIIVGTANAAVVTLALIGFGITVFVVKR